MLGFLIPIGGGDPIPLNKPSLVVGRRPSCDIRLNYPNVSSHHCHLQFINGFWRAADVSTNGTKVNGERIEEKFLQPGDTVAFARHAFEIQYTPDPNAVPPTEVEEDPFAMSLLEKAGLLHRRDKREQERRNRMGKKANSSGPGNRSEPAVPQEKLPPDDDDLALEWLND